MATTAGKNPVDSDENQWREVASDKETIQRPKAAEQDTCGLRRFEEISKISPMGLYILSLSV